ncbi:probable low-specificity L-threonine aldolase 2 isoform X2 [Panthera leo]|uniref:probable low-specificity L-threonine aldolase 2 isoform X2 n=1 Tax=Panthera leo TaxID=9689 RepID=UPI001C69AC79|nr:probable low-specificity L-threonine aldolase 2 isoform X2 [Panthera leo]
MIIAAAVRSKHSHIALTHSQAPGSALNTVGQGLPKAAHSAVEETEARGGRKACAKPHSWPISRRVHPAKPELQLPACLGTVLPEPALVPAGTESELQLPACRGRSRRPWSTAEVEVGEAVPTLAAPELQEKAATLLGVDRTLFVPTNTMANLISVMCHCQRRGSQLLLGQESHLHVYEQGGVAQIAGVHSHPLPDLPHGTLDLLELERTVTRGLGSPYHPVCELICLENTHSSSGGRVLPIDYLRQVRLLAQSCGVRVHLDGARLMNAAVALHVPPARIVEHCDSVSLCFSKGLGAPVGALVGGPKDFIEGAWRLRKALGGGMRQAGVLAAAALVGLADVEEVLLRDHQNARRFAQGLQELASPICSVDLAAVETNMVMVTVDGLPPQELCRRLQAVSADEVAQTGRAVRVLLFPWTGRSVRAVWHRDVSARDTELALRKWGFVLKQLGALRTG